MGNNKFKLTKLALALGLTASLSACFSDNDNNDYVAPPVPTQDVAVPPTATEVQAGSVTVNIVDINGAPLADTVTAMISFTSSEDGLLTAAGNALTDADKSTTASSFAFTVGSIPTDGISYDYVISADGFLNNSGTLTLSTTDNVVAQEIRLTPRTLADSDVAIVADTKALEELVPEGENTTVSYDPTSGLSVSGDKTEIALPQTINKAGVAVGGSTVKIKNGTQFLDKDGTALATVPKMTVAYFANEATRNDEEAESAAATSSSLDAFPGGLALSVASDPNSTEQVEGSFTSGGFVAIELVDDAGKKVKSFGEGNSITVAMQVDKKTSNPCPVTLPAGTADIAAYAEANGFKNGVCTVAAPVARKIAAGDIFPVWSYDEEVGKWGFESYGEVTDSGNASTFDVSVDVNHLSYWNLDYFNNNKCSSVKFNILDNTDSANIAETKLVLEINGYRRVLTSYTGDYSSATIYNPPGFPVKMKVLRDGENVLDGLSTNTDGAPSALSVSNICDLQDKDLTLTIAPPTIVTKQIKTQLVCSNTADFDVNTAPVPTPAIVALFKNNSYLQSIYSTGTFSVKLEQGASYTANYYDYNTGNWISTNVAANATAATFDIPVTCEVETVPVTGTGTTGGS
ncbi:MAG TPA: hypothetical protein ENH88_12865 [Pseudoalteromonas prydzensis]|uniref:Big-1 domain-containing protein n=2 Tax=root TaxID=1 RepID=A0A7V1CZS3_9GAMM|nr:hypothetical protein [Pseudoalteromonas prydzensis]HEA17311.1 hypothetical protein [Pseudoalteromonas prydzensis]